MSKRAGAVEGVAVAVTWGLLGVLGWSIVAWVPCESTMGLAQRIFYVHVPAAAAAFLGYLLVFLASGAFLKSGRAVWDRVAVGACEVGLVFGAAVLVSGPLWAKPVWGTYWRWEPRLTTALILFCVYVGYLMLRRAGGDADRTRRLAAVVGVAAFVNVPLVYFSVRLWAPEQQLHPVHVALAPRMAVTLVVGMVAFILVFGLLLLQAVRLYRLSDRIDALGDRLWPEETEGGRRGG